MTDQQILEKAIQKAIEGGWKDSIEYDEYHPLETIFEHDFAKALWGEKIVVDKRVPASPFDDDPSNDTIITTAAWRYHLQHMVIAEDPVAYLGEHI